MKPQTQYTKSGRINIAYQVFGSGEMDLVYIPGWVSNIDLMWECSQLVDFLTALSKHVRVILFDKRGTGLSDRVADLSPLEDRMDDIRAVMDAAGSERAILFGHSEGGSVSALFSATYPDRTVALITFGVFAKRRWSEDYPWAPTDEERQEVYSMIENHWGSGRMDLASLAPSMKDDEVFMDWLASYFRSGASPSAALVLTKMNTEVDIIDILDSIEVPTLLMSRTDDIDVKAEEGKFISERIQGSKLVEFPGNDHLFWVGDAQAVLNEMVSFIAQKKDQKEFNRVLATILKVDVVHLKTRLNMAEKSSSEDLLKRVNQVLANKIAQYRGKLATNEKGSALATFDGPSKAVHCAIEIRNSIQLLGLNVAQGIHIGECILDGSQPVGGRAINMTEDVLSKAEPGDIVTSRTAFSLLSGSGLDFVHMDHIPTFDHAMMQILRLSEHTADFRIENNMGDHQVGLRKLMKNHSFLEDVLQSIENHLTDENYSIQVLCEETGTSERQLQRKLKSITNKSPIQLVRSVRLHRAKELILQQSQSMADAAFNTGFSSQSYFARSFKKEFGYSPSQLRKQQA